MRLTDAQRKALEWIRDNQTAPREVITLATLKNLDRRGLVVRSAIDPDAWFATDRAISTMGGGR